MLPENVQDRAALYVAGELTPAERESLEVVLEFHEELRALVAGLQETVAAVALAPIPSAALAPAGLKARLLQALDALPPEPEPEALVVTDPAGRIEWVNPVFTAMCGYSIEELRGRKPGELLQGPDTEAAAVARIRAAVASRRSCRETLVNYHKDGSPYRADVRISPVLDEGGHPLWFVARERKLAAAGCAG
ncbi:Blue-light-activated protein [Lacunisphaera limnophila]|uniref:Blue-light-activated protein n=1 Tax=Lacunisphaera limnophila TaxID=1838286 RepID=A0A1D8AU70_9BACT|nr:PAS domain-containing protein [Lacunisphaera limnophila]AOS44438.1 Blue-light-activated protein [Lacunisphaera limnophila]